MERKELWSKGAAAAGVAAVTNLALYAAASAAGVEFEVASGTVTAAQVATSSIVPILLGTALAVVAPSRLRVLLTAAAVVAVLSLGGPLSMGVDSGTKVTLALMHLVAGAAFVALLRRPAAVLATA